MAFRLSLFVLRKHSGTPILCKSAVTQGSCIVKPVSFDAKFPVWTPQYVRTYTRFPAEQHAKFMNKVWLWTFAAVLLSWTFWMVFGVFFTDPFASKNLRYDTDYGKSGNTPEILARKELAIELLFKDRYNKMLRQQDQEDDDE